MRETAERWRCLYCTAVVVQWSSLKNLIFQTVGMSAYPVLTRTNKFETGMQVATSYCERLILRLLVVSCNLNKCLDI